MTETPSAAPRRTRFGLTPDQWDDALAEMRRSLCEVASARATITYGELAARVGAGKLTARSAGLGVLLGQVCDEEDSRRDIMLGSLVVRADSGIPGEGYFRYAAELGCDVSDPATFWQTQVESVWRAYAG